MLTSDVPSNTADAIPSSVSPALLGRGRRGLRGLRGLRSGVPRKSRARKCESGNLANEGGVCVWGGQLGEVLGESTVSGPAAAARTAAAAVRLDAGGG